MPKEETFTVEELKKLLGEQAVSNILRKKNLTRNRHQPVAIAVLARAREILKGEISSATTNGFQTIGSAVWEYIVDHEEVRLGMISYLDKEIQQRQHVSLAEVNDQRSA